MRKFLVGGLLAATFGGGAMLAGATAFANSTCGGGTVLPSTPLGQVTVNPGNGGTAGTLQVCADNSPVINGTVTASGNANPPGGYAVADGQPTNPGAGAGYIGVEGGSSGGVNVVGCSSGDYNDGSSTTPTGPNDGPGTTDANGNNIIVGTGGNSLSQVASGNCAVTK